MKIESLTPTERKFLQYIAEHPYAIADDFVEDLYAGKEKSRWNVYKYLERLEARAFISSKLVDSDAKNSPRYFYLLTSGSRALGIAHSKTPTSRFDVEVFKRNSIKLMLRAMCKNNDWDLFEDNEECRYALVSYLTFYDEQEGNKILSDQAYLHTLPKKIQPDMVLAKHGEYLIIMISSIKMGIVEFNRKIEKYKEVLPKVRFIAINLNEQQKSAWLTILGNQQPQYYNFPIVQAAKGSLILTYDEVAFIETSLAE